MIFWHSNDLPENASRIFFWRITGVLLTFYRRSGVLLAPEVGFFYSGALKELAHRPTPFLAKGASFPCDDGIRFANQYPSRQLWPLASIAPRLIAALVLSQNWVLGKFEMVRSRTRRRIGIGIQQQWVCGYGLPQVRPVPDLGIRQSWIEHAHRALKGANFRNNRDSPQSCRDNLLDIPTPIGPTTSSVAESRVLYLGNLCRRPCTK